MAMSVEASPKQRILDLVGKMTISEAQFNAFNEKIEKKLAERVLPARDAKMQPEQDRISALYISAVEMHKANLMTQYDLGKRTIQQIEAIEDLSKVGEILQVFQTALSPVLEEHKKLEREIQGFESQIIPLLPLGTRFVQ